MDVTMPQLGETVTEGTITRWLKNVGEHVDADEPLFEVSTDKVDSEVPAPVAGVISEILVPEGETVEVGTRLAVLGDAASAAAAPAVATAAPPAAGSRARTRTDARAGAHAGTGGGPAGSARPALGTHRRHPRRPSPRPSRWRPAPPGQPSLRAPTPRSRRRSCAGWWPSGASTSTPSGEVARAGASPARTSSTPPRRPAPRNRRRLAVVGACAHVHPGAHAAAGTAAGPRARPRPGAGPRARTRPAPSPFPVPEPEPAPQPSPRRSR